MGLILSIAGGGAIGAVARHLSTVWIVGTTPEDFPWGTAIINVTGSFLLGFALVSMSARPVSDEVRGFVTVGLLGAFTTFSTFSQETVTLLQAGYYVRAAVYVLGSVSVGLLAVVAGAALASNTVSTSG